MKYLLLLLTLLLGLNCRKKLDCKFTYPTSREIILSNQEFFGYGVMELSHKGRELASSNFNKQIDSIYILDWDIEPYLYNVPNGDTIIIDYKLFDWRDKSYYYLSPDTLIK